MKFFINTAAKLRTKRSSLRCDYIADGLGVRNKNVSFLSDERFQQAWNEMLKGEHGRYRKAKWFNGRVPDIRWRAHIHCWAATSALKLDGDFVECGTATGISARTVCEYVNFASIDKTYYLFDTFSGIPIVEGMSGEERAYAKAAGDTMYFECYDAAQSNFSKFANVKLVRGILPDSLDHVDLGKICYLHVDLNNAVSEMATMDRLFDRITPGGLIIIDDYAFAGHENQYEAWNAFAAKVDTPIATLPTGQGMMIKR